MAEEIDTDNDAENDTPEFYSVKKSIDRLYTVPTNGSFAHVSSDNGERIAHQGFVYCREQFHGSAIALGEGVLFQHGAGQGKNVAAFLHEFETKLGHDNLSESGPTNVSTISWFRPAQFWRRNAMRRSLFTILLRCGVAYRRRSKNFEAALFSQDYASRTRIAIERFLAGYTWYSGNDNMNWYSRFYGMNKGDVERTLTRRPITDADLLKYACARLNLTKAVLAVEYRKEKHPLRKAPEPAAQAAPVATVVVSEQANTEPQEEQKTPKKRAKRNWRARIASRSRKPAFAES